MSIEFNSYLDGLPIHIIKLTEGSTLIAHFIEDDGEETLLSKPFAMEVMPFEDSGKSELFMQEWLYGAETEEVIISNDKIITHAVASRKLKKFYSKVLLQEKISGMVDEMQDLKIPNMTDVFQSIIDGLEPKDSTEDEDILSPWRDRMQWSPKSDTPIEDDDEEFPF